ncbi:MAG: hypothetical protein JNL82_15765 [Myxococcales bacterium]|nr:hypothetical protein [Myxococcales bacterium]
MQKTGRIAARTVWMALVACGDAGGGGEAATSGDAGSSSGADSGEPTGGDTSGSTGSTSGDTGSTSGGADILDELAEIDGLDVEERDSPIDGYRYFVLGYRQPADHDDPDGPSFVQRMTLLHRDPAAPLVMVTSGYFIYPEFPGLEEPSQLLKANQLAVEHRFFEPSRPDAADWADLTIVQAASDHHRVAEALRPLYDGAWVATGASKGGMAAMYFRRFFPDDVDVTIPYVAPQSYGDADPRYLEFVATRGEPACRQALLDTQREVLLRREAMVAYMQGEATAEGFTYTYLNEDQALESAALELIFTFWQYEGASLCAQVPAVDASDAEVWDFLNAITAPRYWSDGWYLGYEPYFWQAGTQLGYPAYEEANVADLMMYPGLDVAATYVSPQRGAVALDAEAMPDIADWLASSGERILLVYGEHDPYTAAAFDPAGNPGVLRLVVPGGNHGAQIGQLDAAERDAALAALEAWTGVTPELPAAAPWAPRRGLRASW